jgi:hypothetical protein
MQLERATCLVCLVERGIAFSPAVVKAAVANQRPFAGFCCPVRGISNAGMTLPLPWNSFKCHTCSVISAVKKSVKH